MYDGIAAIKHQHADYYYLLAYSFESQCLYFPHTHTLIKQMHASHENTRDNLHKQRDKQHE